MSNTDEAKTFELLLQLYLSLLRSPYPEGIVCEMDALPLEYKLQNRPALRELDLADVVNDPVRAGVCVVYGKS